MDTLIILTAKYLIWAGALILAWQFWRESRLKGMQFFVITLTTFALSLILARIATKFYFDPRPFVAGDFIPLIAGTEGNGFPSDHALFAGAIAAIATLFSLPVGVALWVLAFLVGAARVLGDVHHWIDIIGGFAIATASALVAAYGWALFKSRNE